MNKLYTAALSVAFFVAHTINLNAQCVPDPNMTGPFSPTEEEGLPTGVIGFDYEAVVTINPPSDTTLGGFNASIDSVVLTSISGLPDDFDYDCSSSNCSFPGGEKGCFRIFGLNSDSTDAKTFQLQLNLTFHGSSGPIPLSIPVQEDLYEITLENAPTGVNQINEADLQFVIGPNPINKYSKLKYDLPSTAPTNITVYNLIGNAVYNSVLDGNQGRNTYDMSILDLDAGIYFIELKQGDYQRTTRFVIQD